MTHSLPSSVALEALELFGGKEIVGFVFTSLLADWKLLDSVGKKKGNFKLGCCVLIICWLWFQHFYKCANKGCSLHDLMLSLVDQAAECKQWLCTYAGATAVQAFSLQFFHGKVPCKVLPVWEDWHSAAKQRAPCSSGWQDHSWRQLLRLNSQADPWWSQGRNPSCTIS